MGFVREKFGRAHTESRRESFYFSVHYNKDKCCFEGPDDPLPTMYAEFAYDDLPTMIQALVDLRDNDSRYAEWLKKQAPESCWHFPAGHTDCPGCKEAKNVNAI